MDVKPNICIGYVIYLTGRDTRALRLAFRHLVGCYKSVLGVSGQGTLQVSLSGILPPNSAIIGYAIEEVLISVHLSTDAVGALRKVWVLMLVIIPVGPVC